MALKSYETTGITVRFDTRRCIHAAECVRGLPSVFDSSRRPWIQPDAAGVDEIVSVVERCPSGALTYERSDGGPQEAALDPPVVRLARHGPLHVRGRLRLLDTEGRDIETGPRMALCRCGASKNKPFCDDSHGDVGFRDDEGEAEA